MNPVAETRKIYSISNGAFLYLNRWSFLGIYSIGKLFKCMALPTNTEEQMADTDGYLEGIKIAKAILRRLSHDNK